MRSVHPSIGLYVWTALPLLTVGFGCQDGATIDVVELSVEAEPSRIDFGDVPLGNFRTRNVFVRNMSGAPVPVEAVLRGSSATSPFSVVDLPGGDLPQGNAWTLSVTFQPQDLAAYEGAVLLRSLRDAELEFGELTLLGVGVPSQLDVQPRSLDFGAVESGSRAQDFTRVANEGSVPLEVRARFLEGAGLLLDGVGRTCGAGRCSFYLEANPRPFILGPGEIRVIPVWFEPREAGLARGAVEFSGCRQPGCGQRIDFTGTGITQQLLCTPSTVDFAVVPPSECASRVVQCVNQSTRDVTLVDWRVVDRELFSSDSPRVVDLGPNERLDIAVEFCPIEIGASATELILETREKKESVSLRGEGGRPVLALSTPVLSFGWLAVGVVSSPRLLHVRNEGTGTLRVQTAAAVTEGITFDLEEPSFLEISEGETATVTVRARASRDGDHQGSLTIDSNDREQPSVTVGLVAQAVSPRSCDIEVLPERLDFGSVGLGSKATRIVSVTNRGTERCFIGESDLSQGGAFSIDRVLRQSLGNTPSNHQTYLEPGRAAWMTVSFTPTQLGSEQDQLRVAAQGPNGSYVSRVLVGVGTPGGCEVSPSVVDFGVHPVGCRTPLVRTVYVRSLDGPTSHVPSIRLSPATEFFVDGSSASLLGTVYPVEVSFLPPEHADVFQGELEISIGDRRCFAELIAETRVRPVRIDRFRQRVTPRPGDGLDVLFVVDNGRYMVDARAVLAPQRHFTEFLAALNRQGVHDYRLALTTTDVEGGAPGRFIGPPISSSTIAWAVETEFYGQMNRIINAPQSDSYGMLATVAALSEPNLSGTNGTFSRTGVPLQIIYLSNRDDESDFGATFPLLQRQKSRPDLLTISSIVGPPPYGCGTRDRIAWFAEPGHRYVRAAHSSGGSEFAFCSFSEDWQSTLRALSLDPYRPRRHFSLEQRAVPSSLEVKVDSRVTAEFTPRGDRNWAFRSDINSVEFRSGSVPPPRSDVEIAYETACNDL